MSHVNIKIGRRHYQLIRWDVTECTAIDGELCLVVHPPRIEFSRDLCGGIIRWALCVGYVEVRRMCPPLGEADG